MSDQAGEERTEKQEPVEWEPADLARLHATYEKATGDFDTALRALAGGALAISITFVHDIAKHPRHTWSLALAWPLFGLALALNLVSFLTSARASGSMLRVMIGGVSEDLPHGRITDVLNWLSLISFLGGVLFLVLFALLNL
jgi:formate/nitrite transporter FocA (FNT family)